MNNQNFIISYGDSVFNNQMSASTLNDVIERIKADLRIKKSVKNVRSILDKKERNEYKTANLPFFNLGAFQDNKRLTQNFLSSEFMIVDIDNLDDQQLEEVKNKLINDNRVFIYFISPSGNGYKIVYRFAEAIKDSKKFSENYKYYAQHIGEQYGVETDKTSDSARACFFSHDPDLYLNEDAECLEVKEFVETVETIDFTSISSEDEKFLPDAVECLRDNINGYDDWSRAGMALASLGEHGRNYFHDLSNNSRYDDTPKEIDLKFDNFLHTASGKIQIATLFEIAKSYGFTYSANAQPKTAPIDTNSYVEEMKKQFALDDARVIGELIGFGLDEYNEIATNLDGIQPGFYHLAADTNIGKTAVYTNLAIDMLDSNDNLSVLFFALDDSKKYAAYRYLSILSELKFKDVKYGVNNLKDPADKEALKYAREQFIKYVEDERLLIYDISDIQHIDQVEKVIKNYNSKNIVVIIDGLYNLEVSDGSKEGIRQENIERAQKVKKLVDVYSIPVFTTGEFRKKMKSEGENKKPTIDDLMETGKFAYNANVVWLLYPEDQKRKNDPEVKLKLEYAKNKISEFKGIQEITFIRAKGKIRQGWSTFNLNPFYGLDDQGRGITLADLGGEDLD